MTALKGPSINNVVRITFGWGEVWLLSVTSLIRPQWKRTQQLYRTKGEEGEGKIQILHLIIAHSTQYHAKRLTQTVPNFKSTVRPPSKRLRVDGPARGGHHARALVRESALLLIELRGAVESSGVVLWLQKKANTMVRFRSTEHTYYAGKVHWGAGIL